MQHRTRILSHVRSNLVAYIALFFALSGSAYAAGGFLVYSDNIVDGQVFSVDVADESLRGVDVRNGGLTGADVADGALGGIDIADGSVFGADIANGSLTGVDIADNSLFGADIVNGSLSSDDVADGSLYGGDIADGSLTGTDIAENTLSVAAMGCQSGKVLGFARVKGQADIPSLYTSDPAYIDIVNNCSGGEVLVRSAGYGVYHVKFVGNPAGLAVATSNADGHKIDSTLNDNIITIAKEYSDAEGWYFRVEVQDVCNPEGLANVNGVNPCADGASPDDGNFTIMLP